MILGQKIVMEKKGFLRNQVLGILIYIFLGQKILCGSENVYIEKYQLFASNQHDRDLEFCGPGSGTKFFCAVRGLHKGRGHAAQQFNA